jgi:hypothetical protein
LLAKTDRSNLANCLLGCQPNFLACQSFVTIWYVTRSCHHLPFILTNYWQDFYTTFGLPKLWHAKLLAANQGSKSLNIYQQKFLILQDFKLKHNHTMDFLTERKNTDDLEERKEVERH